MISTNSIIPQQSKSDAVQLDRNATPMSKTSGSSTLERAPIDLVALREEGRQNLVDVLQEVRDATRAGMDSLACLERIGRAAAFPVIQVTSSWGMLRIRVRICPLRPRT